MTRLSDKSIRKAAVFLRGLAPEASEAVLTRLTAAEAESLRTAVAQLDAIDPQEHARVVDELRRRPPQVHTEQDGVELDFAPSSLAASLQPPAPAPRVVDQVDADWFAPLHDADPGAIAGFLRSEQPRAAALVLSYLSPDLASAVLAAFPPHEQSRLIALLSSQGEADPQAVGVIAKELAEWIRKQDVEKRRRADRLATIRSIFAAAPEERREALLTELREEEPTLVEELGLEPAPIETPASRESDSDAAEQQSPPESEPAAPPRPPRLAYEQLERLDSRSLARALGMLDSRTALLSLAEASDKLLNRITRPMPRRAGAELRRRLKRIGPTTLAEIDQSKFALAYAAEQALKQP